MIETVVESIRVSLVTQHRVVILKEVDGDRHLPIWIGVFEAEAIAMVLQGVTAARPLPYDLLTSMTSELGAEIKHIVVTDLSHDVYYARIVLESNGSGVEIDSRPSDAIALAVRAKVPILVDETVMDRSGVRLGDDDETGDDEVPSRMVSSSTIDEDSLSAYRDFIDTLDLDDFGKPNPS